MRDIPEFKMGFVTDGNGIPRDGTAVAYSDLAGIERELQLEGEGAIDLMPTIVSAINAYDEMTAALRVVKSCSGWDGLPADARALVGAALEKAEAYSA